MNITANIKYLLQQALKENWGPNILDEIAEVNLEIPASKKFGDLTTNVALVLAQKLQKAPLVIAQQLKEVVQQKLKEANLEDKIEKIEAEGAGFLNFFLSRTCLYEILSVIAREKENFGQLKLGKGQKLHLEFVSANPTGPLNVAHARQATFGDTLANILEFSGYRLTREYYLNDEGVQIEILGESVRAKYLGLLGEPFQFPASGYKGRYIDDLAQGLVQKYGKRFVQDNQKNRIFFSQFATEKILKKIKQDLKVFGVNFNSWFSQRQLNRSGKINKALELLKKKGFLYQKDGAWWLATTKFGDDKDRVVIKSDLKLTYLAPDIAYHQLKFTRGFAKMINIWGPDHHGYIPRVKAAISALGYDAECVSFLIVQLVSLSQADKIIPMSTREGQYISLADIICAVGKDVARFFFLMRKRDAHLHFDLELAKKQSWENPVYYIQYAHARTLNILKFAKNAKRPTGERGVSKNLSLLDKPEELDLIRTLKIFPQVVESCALNLEPHRMTAYLQELAKDFHCFYERHRVITEDSALTQARLTLVDAVRIILKMGLRLLAISAPEKM